MIIIKITIIYFIQITHPDDFPSTDTRLVQINSRVCDAVFVIVLVFIAYKKLLCRTEMRTIARICFQSIRTV